MRPPALLMSRRVLWRRSTAAPTSSTSVSAVPATVRYFTTSSSKRRPREFRFLPLRATTLRPNRFIRLRIQKSFRSLPATTDSLRPQWHVHFQRPYIRDGRRRCSSQLHWRQRSRQRAPQHTDVPIHSGAVSEGALPVNTTAVAGLRQYLQLFCRNGKRSETPVFFPLRLACQTSWFPGSVATPGARG